MTVKALMKALRKAKRAGLIDDWSSITIDTGEGPREVQTALTAGETVRLTNALALNPPEEELGN